MRRSRQRHDPLKNLVGFLVGQVQYAVPIQVVREIINPLEAVPIPHGPKEVSGVADYRGNVVIVIDMRKRFGLSVTTLTRKTKWIVLQVNDRLMAIVVDGVTDVFGTGGQDLRPAPDLGAGTEVRGIVGVTNYDSHLIFVLDVSRLRTLVDGLASPPQDPKLGPVPSSKALP